MFVAAFIAENKRPLRVGAVSPLVDCGGRINYQLVQRIVELCTAASQRPAPPALLGSRFHFEVQPQELLSPLPF